MTVIIYFVLRVPSLKSLAEPMARFAYLACISNNKQLSLQCPHSTRTIISWKI